ncbi:MAG TPA: T9SS C-terminal target domain-containing protein, partial [Flavobacterium sp.]|nr:T9SS C-terminal target domain-containing protein [Flavobacterium sp.]
MKKFLLFALLILSDASSAQIINIPDSAFKSLLLGAGDEYPNLARNSEGTPIVIDANNDGEIQIVEALAVWKIEFHFPANPISTMEGIQHFTNLRTLICNGAGINVLPLDGLTNLTELECGANDILSLDLSDCTALRILHCHSNSISALDLTMFPLLEMVTCSDNQLQSLQVHGLANLTYLACSVNELSVLSLAGLTALESLTCGNNF